MANTGLPWDRSKLQEVEKDYEKDIENLGREFHLELDEALPDGEKLPRDPDGSFNLRPRTTGSVRLGTKQYAGFNIGSPKQLLEKLTLVLGELVDPKTQKGIRESAGVAGICRCAPGDCFLFGVEKAEKTPPNGGFAAETPGCGWVYPGQLLAAGGRDGPDDLSDPNLQQIPRDEQFRSAVVAPGGLSSTRTFPRWNLRLAASGSGRKRDAGVPGWKRPTHRHRRGARMRPNRKKCKLRPVVWLGGKVDLATTQLV